MMDLNVQLKINNDTKLFFRYIKISKTQFRGFLTLDKMHMFPIVFLRSFNVYLKAVRF